MDLLAIQFHWRPWTSPLHIFAGAGLLAVLAIVAYSRTFHDQRKLSAGLLGMRLCVIAALALLLMGPSELPPVGEGTARAPLRILLDISKSMNVADCEDRTRIQAAVNGWLSEHHLQALAAEHEVELLGFGAQVRPLVAGEVRSDCDRMAVDRESLLAESIRKTVLGVTSKSRDAALLVLSDGRASDGDALRAAARLAKARGVGIFTVCLGGPTKRRDVQLVAVPRQEFFLAGEPGQILVRIRQAGYDEATTTLRVTGGEKEFKHDVRFEGKSSVTVEVPVTQAKSGLYAYTVRIDPIDGEQETSNNEQAVFCNVIDQRIRVLLLEGQPYWDTKFLAQSLRKDERLELTQITRLSPGKQETILTRTGGGGGARLPSTAEEFAAYDVVILGRGMECLLDAERVSLLCDFVSRGGGHVIFARGRSYDPRTPAGRRMGRDLAVLEPVIWAPGMAKNLTLSLTATGRGSPCFSFAHLAMDSGDAISRLPGFRVMPLIEREKSAARVLARATTTALARASDGGVGDPAVVTMDYGRGRIVAILGEGLWQWSFLSPKDKQFDGIYDAFWSNLVRWLATSSAFGPGADVSMKLSRSAVKLGTAVTVEIASRGTSKETAAPKLTVTDSAGETTPLPLVRARGEHRMQASFTPAAAGTYTLALAAPGRKPDRIERRFSVYDLDTERLNTSADPEAMAMISRESGGEVLGPGDAPRFRDMLSKRRAAIEAPRQPYYIWDKALVLIIMLGWIGAEWFFRRLAGLL